MKRGHYLSVAMVVLLAAMLSGCSSSGSTKTTVTVNPSTAVVVLGGTQQFAAGVSGPSDTTVSWSISGSGCSGSACGTIDANGLYTAPTQVFSPNTVTITATSHANSSAKATATVTVDSGVRVQISATSAALATSEQFSISATVTGTTNTQVTWNVAGIANGDTTVGQICVIGSNPCQAPTSPVNSVYYLAPASVPPSAQETVSAVSVVDVSQKANLTATIFSGVDPVVAAISPTSAPQGAVAEDVYVKTQSPSSFFSTSTVLVNGQPVPTTFISTELIRGHVPTALFQSSGAVQISVERQNGDVSNSIGMQVIPQRPEIISYSPVSVPQCPTGTCGPAAITLDGGYFSPSTTVQFNGQAASFSLSSSNRMSVTIPGSALQTAGLYQLTVRNPGAVLPEAAVNLAVEPSPTSNAPSVVASATVGAQPSAVAVDEATGLAVVANTGDNTISLVDLTACSGGTCPASTVPVGNQPTGVAVDWLRDLAFVVNQGDKTLSIVDLSTSTVTQTVSLPAAYVPVSIGENPLTEHVLVANQQTNTVTVVDLSQSPAVVTPVDVTQGGTRPGGTGVNPRVQVVPRLDWAIITPGSSGAITAVDMSHKAVDPSTGISTYSVVFSLTFSATTTGIALNQVTDQLVFTDPNSTTVSLFNLLNESVTAVTTGSGTGLGFTNVAATASPLTNIGLVVTRQTNSVQFIDMGSGRALGISVTVGTTPVAAAMDPVTNEAVIVNQGSGTVSVVSLGTVRTPSLTQVSAQELFASATTQPLTLLGGGFQSGAAVRVDGAAIPSANVTVVSGREINVTLPASLVSGPRLLNLDVLNPDGTLSNIFQLPVVQAIPVGTAPIAVAYDPDLKLAVVTNSGDNTVSLVDLGTKTVTATVNVGENPQAVAVIPRLATAVVADTNDNTAALVNLTTQAASVVSLTAAVGPIAVDINQDTGQAWIANQQSNNVSLLSTGGGTSTQTLAVDQGPLGVSVDSALGYAAILCSTQSPPTIDIANTQGTSTFLTAHLTGANLPIGVTLDPVHDQFIVADSTGNRVLIVDPVNAKFLQNIATGINPTSIAYNFQTTEAVTVNTASHTASAIEISPSGSQVRALILADGSSQQSVAIDPLTNLLLVVDQANNRLLLIPSPH
jgi:YVTN family beta-propeller protein